MSALKESGKYTITSQMKEQLVDFYGNYATEAEVADTIKTLYENEKYIIDTHTAVAANVYGKCIRHRQKMRQQQSLLQQQVHISLQEAL